MEYFFPDTAPGSGFLLGELKWLGSCYLSGKPWLVEKDDDLFGAKESASSRMKLCAFPVHKQRAGKKKKRETCCEREFKIAK